MVGGWSEARYGWGVEGLASDFLSGGIHLTVFLGVEFLDVFLLGHLETPFAGEFGGDVARGFLICVLAVRVVVGVGLKFDDGGKGAVFGVGDEVLNNTVAGGRGELLLAREVLGGRPETVEEEAGAFGFERAVGDADEDLGDGELDGGAVFGEWEFEANVVDGEPAWRAGAWAGGVVEVAEVFLAEGWGAAAVAIGEDMAALEAFGVFGLEGFGGHGRVCS